MKTLVGWVHRAFERQQTWALEYFLAYQSTVWGVWLLLPFDSFDVVPSAYTVLGLVPEPIWGLIFTSHGLAYLTVLWHGRTDLCRYAALVLGWLWLTVLVSLLLTVPLAPSTPAYACYVMACSVAYVRLDWFVRQPARVTVRR